MYRTLEELKISVERLIAEQGKDAPCAGFVFTGDDVCDIDDDGNFNIAEPEIVDAVLNSVGEDDYIYELIGNNIQEAMIFHRGDCDD